MYVENVCTNTTVVYNIILTIKLCILWLWVFHSWKLDTSMTFSNDCEVWKCVYVVVYVQSQIYTLCDYVNVLMG